MVIYNKNPFELLIRLMPHINQINLDELQCVIGNDRLKRGSRSILTAEKPGLAMFEQPLHLCSCYSIVAIPDSNSGFIHSGMSKLVIHGFNFIKYVRRAHNLPFQSWNIILSGTLSKQFTIFDKVISERIVSLVILLRLLRTGNWLLVWENQLVLVTGPLFLIQRHDEIGRARV